MGAPRKIYPRSDGVDFVNLEVDRGVRGVINIPCFYLDGMPFDAPTVWLATEFSVSLGSRRANANRLRSFLNEILEDKPPAERKKVGFDFWGGGRSSRQWTATTGRLRAFQRTQPHLGRSRRPGSQL